MKFHSRRLIAVSAAFVTALSASASAEAAQAAAPLSKGDQPMKSVVIVHGAFADASGWDKVIPLLQAKGLNVVAVQNPLSSLANDVDATKRAIDAQKGPVVLVGHSWGGVVITEAGANDKVKSLVYVAAFAPSAGQSVTDLTKDLPPAPWASSLIADAGGYVTLPAEVVTKSFAQDLPAAKTKIMAATQGPILGKSFDEKVASAAWEHKPSWYVVASDDRMIAPSLQQAMAKKIGATTSTVKASHVVFISQPQEVAAAIIAAAAAIK
ncbi:MAG: alpha/beta hydrolase [Gammaproteobacteria bacterium]|nr:alpha/beta hydrolase [Gammaproteobacteria bacterium]